MRNSVDPYLNIGLPGLQLYACRGRKIAGLPLACKPTPGIIGYYSSALAPEHEDRPLSRGGAFVKPTRKHGNQGKTHQPEADAAPG